MDPIYICLLWLPIFWLLVLLPWRRKRAVIMRKAVKRRSKEEKKEMTELAKRFIGKECLIYALDKQFTGTIREVSEGAVLIENEGSTEAINLEFVLRIREYPRNKKGKKKSVILD